MMSSARATAVICMILACLAGAGYLLVGGAAGSAHPSVHRSSTGSSRNLACLKAPMGVRARIRSSLKRHQGLVNSAIVPSRDKTGQPRGFGQGVFFVSAKVGAGLATWALNSPAITGHEGARVVPVSRSARRISKPPIPSRGSLNGESDGYGASRRCSRLLART